MKINSLITISIVSHGNSRQVSSLLASLQKHEPDTKRFQIILTDNLGTELSEFDPAPWSSLNVLRNRRQLGFARNHNQAFEIAEGGFFAILNPDLTFEKPVFEPLLAGLQWHGAALIAPQMVDIAGMLQDSFRILPTPWEIIRRRLPGYQFQPLAPDQEGLIHPDWVAAMFWIMPSEVYRTLKGMDEKYRLYFEDVDFCTRARLAGLKILVDTHLQVRHDAQRSSRRKPYFLFLHMWSALLFFTSPVYRQARLRLH